MLISSRPVSQCEKLFKETDGAQLMNTAEGFEVCALKKLTQYQVNLSLKHQF